MKRLLVILLLFLLLPLLGWTQDRQSTTSNSDSALYYNELADQYENIDTIIQFSLLSLKFCNITDYHLIASNYYNISKSYYLQNKSKESLTICFKALNNHLLCNAKPEIARDYILMAKCYHDINIKDSIFYFFNLALDIYTELQDTVNLSYTYQSIGSVNVDLGYPSNALVYYRKALQLDSLSNNYLELAFDYQNIGFVENELNNTTNALYYFGKSVEIFDTTYTDDPYYIYSKYATYLGLASTYIAYAKTTNNKSYADSCYFYIKKIGDYFADNGIYSSQFYKLLHYANYLSFCNRDREAVKVLLDCHQYIDEDEGIIMLTQYYKLLSETYEKLGDYKNAIESYKKMHGYEISSSNDSTMNMLAEFKADQEMKIQEAAKRQLELEKSQLKTIVTSLIVVLVLTALLVFFIVRALKIKHRANEQLSDVNKKVYSSIKYAQKIQKAVFTQKSEIDRLFPENFVFYRPRDIVSGDFYHAVQCGRYNVLVTADCTGHGIPGAFLSMLGISALKEFCVTENDAANPGTILDRLRDFVRSTLISNNDTLIADGMDMTICSFDFSSMEMRYAIANQTIFFIRRGKVVKLRGDLMPVGNYVVVREHFTTYIQPIEKGDLFYCFSDGIPDQLGGEITNQKEQSMSECKGKKFSIRGLMSFLQSNYYRPLDVQCRLLEKTINQWRNGRSVIDDMTMIGLKV